MDPPALATVFVLRVYDPAESQPGAVNVIIEDTRTAQRHAFTRWADLHAFLLQARNTPTEPPLTIH